MAIEMFIGNYRFLSNFWMCSVIGMDGKEYPSVEHAYQAAKTDDVQWQERIRTTRYPSIAKRYGQQVPVRDGWDSVKLDVMLTLLRDKFSKPPLREWLLRTVGMPLIEGNTWGETFWGVYNGKGHNHLGRLLMQVRDEIVMSMSVYAK